MLPILNSKDCNDYLRNIWEYRTLDKHENIYVVFLDSRFVRIDFMLVDSGKFSECKIKAKKIVEKAFKLKSKHIVLAHNHPSGRCKPSDNDIIATNNLKTALKILKITLEDHLILTENEYYSFKDSGLMSA